MREALQDLDPVLLRIKLGAVSALAQTLRRYTSLNHLAQAARAVLKNPAQINQMLIDLSRVDFNNVQVSALNDLNCDFGLVGSVLNVRPISNETNCLLCLFVWAGSGAGFVGVSMQ